LSLPTFCPWTASAVAECPSGLEWCINEKPRSLLDRLVIVREATAQAWLILAAAFVLLLALAVPDQSLEAFRVLAEDSVAVDRNEVNVTAWKWLARIASALPSVALIWGAIRAGRLIVFALLTPVAVGFVIFGLIFWNRRKQMKMARTWAMFMLPGWLFLLLVTIEPDSIASSFGPLAILVMGISSWMPLFVILQVWGRRTRVPALAILAALVLVFSGLDLNDNHEVRHTRGVREGYPPEFTSAFDAWLEARKDRAAYDVYPVFLVAAEGGGLRAAFQTALVLARLQDLCPSFAQHTFVISGVSGGSLGASVFAALAKRHAENGPPRPCSDEGPRIFEKKVHQILGRDYLSPPLATLLGAEVLQRMLPLPIPPTDRARALERAVEQSWTRTTGGYEFTNEFYSLWEHFPNDATPGLFLNATRVETGDRMVISPFNPGDERFNWLVHLSHIDSTMTLPLSSATVLSARFPGVTPSGYLMGDGAKHRYVDGGYFEASGAATLLDALNALRAESRNDFEPIVIRVGFAAPPKRGPQGGDGFDEFVGPIRALFNTQVARGIAATAQLQTAITTLQDQPNHKAAMYSFEFNDSKVRLPLGWLLSQAARKELSRQLETPLPPSQNLDTSRNEGSLQAIMDALTPNR
jgi:predicted acylesterase/phospholipase RssA